MNNKRIFYLKVAIIVIIVLVGIIVNHLFINFKVPEICQTAYFAGDIPDYCYKGQLSFEIKNFDNINTELLFIIDGIIIFLGILATRRQKLKS
jgi:uncharacterized membrane protein